MNDHFSNAGRPTSAMRTRLGEEAGEADDQERAEDHRVFGLGLDADPVRALHVAAHDRPPDTDEEEHADRVAERGVAPRRRGRAGTCSAIGQLVVDLDHDGDHEQADEPEVDAGVHDPGRGVAQQCLHPDAGAEVGEAALGVLAVRAPVVGRAALVVADAQRREPRDDEQHHRDRRVERDLQRGRDVGEHLALDRRVVDASA